MDSEEAVLTNWNMLGFTNFLIFEDAETTDPALFILV